MLIAGTNVTLSYNDTAGTLTINAPGGLDAEAVRDVVGAMFADTFSINFTYSDALDQITADLITNSITYNFLQLINVPPKLLGRYGVGAGNVQEIGVGTDLNLNRTSGELNLPSRFLLMGA